MRITNQVIANTIGSTLNMLRTRMVRLQSEIGTGKRVINQSDDPTAALDSMRLSSQLEILQQWETNISDTSGWVQSTESAVTSILDALARARELAIQAADGGLPAQSRLALASELDTIMSTVLSLANEKHGKYSIFGGFQTDTVPFDFNAGVFTYNGDNGRMRREVGPGVYIEANIPGSDLQLDQILDTIYNLSEDLKNGLAPDYLTQMDQGIDVLINLRSELGSRGRRLEQAQFRGLDMKVNFEDLKGRAEGVDYEKAILDMSQFEMAYRVAIQVGGRILPPTLMDFLQ